MFRNRWLKEKVEAGLHLNTGASDWEEALGRAMVELNIAGVNDRYGQGEAKPFLTSSTGTHPRMAQKYRSLPCWLYQCTEGAVVTRPLYRFFKTVIEPHLMSSMISELPEYDRAQWKGQQEGQGSGTRPAFPCADASCRRSRKRSAKPLLVASRPIGRCGSQTRKTKRSLA